MKKLTPLFKKLLFLFTMLFFTGSVFGQAVMVENFDYTAGTLLTANGWTAHSGGGTNSIQVVSPGLTYAGYIGSGIGNAASLGIAGGEDVNKTFTAQTSGNVYVSFLVNVASATTTGDYCFHLGPNTIATTFRGRFYIKQDGSNNIAFGISQGGAVGTAVFTPYAYALNTTYLIVMRYAIVSGATNDSTSIYINPVVTNPEPTTGWYTTTDVLVDPSDIGSLALRQGSNTASAGVKIDGIRVVTSWANLFPPVPTITVTPSSLTNFTYVFGSGPSAVQSFILHGADLTNDITVALPTNYEFSLSNSPFTAVTTPITLPQVGGTVNDTPIYVRLKAGLSIATYNESIPITSTGAASKTIDCSGMVTYCISKATSTADEDIFNVTIGTLNNTSSCSTTGGTGSVLNMYSNYTALPAPSLSQGTTNAFSISIGTCGTGSYSNAVKIFIDYNQDGDFADAGEEAYTPTGAVAGAHVVTGTITIPPTATVGNTRMRVVCVETSTIANIVACGTYSWGETEDYTINITPVTPMTYVSSTTTHPLATPVLIGSTNQQVIRIEVVTSGSNPTIDLTSLTVNANGTTNVADISNAKIFYTGTSNVFATTTQFGSTVVAPTTTNFNITGTQTLASGTNYFWLTYDISGSATFGNVIDGECTSMIVNSITQTPTVTAPAGNRTIKGPLSGVYTVGASGNYTTITAALSDLNLLGVSAPVTFSLLDASYSTAETFPLIINANPSFTSTNTVTIKPATGVTPVITGTTASSVFAFNGTDYVTIDGSNTVNGTTKDLTIINTYLAGTFNFGVGWYHNGTKGATNCTVKNCIIVGDPTETNSYGLFLNGGGGGFNNTSMINNTIKNCKIGIQFCGIAANITNNGIISGNIIGDVTTPVTIGGILVVNADSTTIIGNEIFGQAVGNTTYNQYGITLGTGSTATKILKNKIHDFYYTGTSGYGCFGINFSSDATTLTEISNNFIYNIKGDGDISGIQYNPAGIYVNTGGNIKINNNTIFMSGDVLGVTRSVFSSGIIISSTATLLDIRNNIIQNSMNLVGTPGSYTSNTYAIYSAAANTAFTSIDFNDYFINGVGANIGYLGANQADLTAWRTASGQDINSFSAAPAFTSATDLHLVPNGNCGIDGKGTPIATIITDIDGDTRNATTPDPGADEFTLIPLVAPTAANQTACFGGTIPDLTATVFGTAKWYSDASLTTLVYTGTPFATGQTAIGVYTYYVIDSLGTCLSPSTTVTLTIEDVPAQPSAIVGNIIPNSGTNEVYSVTNVPGVTYAWTFPTGWTIVSGGTTNSVTVTVGTGNGDITCTPSNSCGNGTPSTLAVTVNNGIPNYYSNDNISIKPNPTEGLAILTIKGLNGDINISIKNTQGRLIYTEKVNAITDLFTKTLNLSNYADGMYYIQIENNGNIFVQKIVKQ